MSGELKLRRGDRLVLATHNRGKLAEFRELLAPFGLELLSAGELGLPEPDETGATFLENARIKAHASARTSGLLALADDSGLCVDAIGGKPGVHTANWASAGPIRDYTVGMRRVENALQAAGATTPAARRGSFNATLCLAHPDGRDVLFVGKVDGTLVWPPRGDKGFGYDPMFMPDGFGVTFGEMEPAQKHGIDAPLSHRARSFQKFAQAMLGTK